MTAALLGTITGVGLWLALTGLIPVRRSLSEVLTAALTPPPGRLDHTHTALGHPTIGTAGNGSADKSTAAAQRGWAARWGAPFIGILTSAGLPTARVRADLTVLGRSPERHLAEQATTALVGFVTPSVFALAAMAVDVTVALAIPLWAGVLLGGAGFLVPTLTVRVEAARRRADFRHALSAFLDLVVISLAGGAGIDGALDDAASVGTGWSFGQIRRALLTARLSRRPPWDTLAQLGTDLGVPELTELAASVSLAGTEGAKVRASLAAKAAALRSRQLIDIETDAQAATERMSLPVVGLFGGFLLFISYPAVARILTDL